MKQHTTPVLNEESPFDLSELFFSTTDRKGIITACNEVFLRVSGFEPAELLGKPHNTIRHPHMPRCVFHLLWEYLLSGRAIGAYVKNISKTGKYYWVFALASPCREGFISVRLKPTSTIFPIVRNLYTELLKIEESFGSDWREGMKASRVELLRQLATLGFESYDEFMNHALRTEMVASNAAADTNVGKAAPNDNKAARLSALRSVFRQIDRMLELQKTLKEKESYFLTLGELMTTIALNASIRAAQLGQDGRSLGVISDEISNVSKEIDRESQELKERSIDLASSLGAMSFNVSQAILQSRAIAFFTNEQKSRQLTAAEERMRYGDEISRLNELLDECVETSLRQCLDAIGHLRRSFNGFDVISGSLEKVLLTIQFSYVTGKTLTARLDGADDFSLLLTDLLSLSESGRSELWKLKHAVREVRANVDDWEITDPHASVMSL